MDQKLVITMKLAITFLTSCFTLVSFGQLTDCSECASRIIEETEIRELSYDEVNLLKNEIYARNGYTFESPHLDDYFSGQDWYKPESSNDNVQLNSTEEKNVRMLRSVEKEIDLLRRTLVKQLDHLKNLALTNDTVSLREDFGWFPDISIESVQWMQETFEYIQPKNIHYYKHQGLFEVAVDNGYNIVYHSITVDGNRVRINHNSATHSQIIDDFGPYTAYRSEMEETYMGWEFTFENGKLKFVMELFAG